MEKTEKIEIGRDVKLLYPFKIGATIPGKSVEYYDLNKGLVYITYLTDNEAKRQSGPDKGKMIKMSEQPTSVLPLSLPVFKAGPPPYTPFRHPIEGINAPFTVVEGLLSRNGEQVCQYNIADPTRGGQYVIYVPPSFYADGAYAVIPLTSPGKERALVADRVSIDEVRHYLDGLVGTEFSPDTVVGRVVHIVVYRKINGVDKVIYPEKISTAFGRNASRATFHIHIKIGNLQFPINIKFVQPL